MNPSPKQTLERIDITHITTKSMMGYFNGGYEGFGSMMGGGAGILCLIISIVVLIDLVLVGIWLWKQIKK